MFRNVRYYRYDADWPDSESKLSETLEESSFRACGPLTERSSGWVAIDPDSSDLLARRVNGADLLRFRSQSRLLPPAVIREELEVRIDEFRERTQEQPSAREKRRLKNEARDELMPKALLRSDRIWGYADIKDQVIGIDTTQTSAAERFIRHLQAPMAGLNLRPLQYKKPLDELLTRILFSDAPKQFHAGRECRMQDLADAGSVVRWTDFDLTDASIRNHVADGMRLTHLAIEYDNVMSCVLDEHGALSKIRFIGMDDDNEDHHDPLAKLDAEFVLLTGTLRRLQGDLRKLLGGYA